MFKYQNCAQTFFTSRYSDAKFVPLSHDLICLFSCLETVANENFTLTMNSVETVDSEEKIVTENYKSVDFEYLYDPKYIATHSVSKNESETPGTIETCHSGVFLFFKTSHI